MEKKEDGFYLMSDDDTRKGLVTQYHKPEE